MARQRSLTPETFLAVAEMVAGHLRMKEIDRWSPHVCKLKFHSFTSEFPEVNDTQLMWAAEQWIQRCGPGFTRYPTWRELMAALYRTENGVANRSWGFRPDLPTYCKPSAEQLALLPERPSSIAPAPDHANAAAYVPFVATTPPLLPPAADTQPVLTQEQWEDYLRQCREASSESEGTAADPGEGPEGRSLERGAVQSAVVQPGAAKRRVSATASSV